VVSAWLDAGVRLVQLRAKALATGDFLDLADRLVRLAESGGARLIVNDRADIAKMSGAAGVHLGQQDLSPADARATVGPDAVVGLSTHNDAQVDEALVAPVDYLAVGPVFATSSKEKPDPVVGLDGVRRAARAAARSGLPVVAIGGITLARAAAVRQAGATSVAVIAGLVGDDPGVRAREFLRALR
jgi:thiamine-phosphate pyrophosphorylase